MVVSAAFTISNQELADAPPVRGHDIAAGGVQTLLLLSPPAQAAEAAACSHAANKNAFVEFHVVMRTRSPSRARR